MGEKLKIVVVTLIILLSALILQSTLLNYIAINGVKPDLSLIILVFISYRRGSVVGEVSGFFAGLFEDFITITPLGFSSIVKTILGFLYGLLQGNIVIDVVFIPILFVVAATVIKGFLIWMIALVFSLSQYATSFFHFNTLIELVYNAILGPFIFALLKLIRIFKEEDKEKA
ncbi:MAG: rod shape-determining protein MreD [Spirochaetales bacterium]|nr:rod shape-determining protein MreD [Spirochaetales bacterium]